MRWRHFFICIFLILGLAEGAGLGPARGQAPESLHASSARVRREVIALISDQLEAFRSHDVLRAYSDAAPALRLQVPAVRFEAIVRQGYPEIWGNQRAEFGIVRDNGERATIAVRVHSAEGSAMYDYILLKQGEGWRIGGVLRHVPGAAGKV